MCFTGCTQFIFFILRSMCKYGDALKELNTNNEISYKKIVS